MSVPQVFPHSLASKNTWKPWQEKVTKEHKPGERKMLCGVPCSKRIEQNYSPEEDFAMRFSGFGFGFSWEKGKSQFGLLFSLPRTLCVFEQPDRSPCFTETSPDITEVSVSAALLQIGGCQGVFLKQERWELPLALAALPLNTLSDPQRDVHKLSPSITAE